MLPGIVHTLKVPRRPPGAGPTALVLAPTRELAQQVEKVAREYAPIMQRNTVCLFGGVSRINQEISLRGGVDICISTPGRLLDFLAAGATNLSHCSYLVLDEVRMTILLLYDGILG
jgi:superfamily II DNA/RNA helicase